VALIHLPSPKKRKKEKKEEKKRNNARGLQTCANLLEMVAGGYAATLQAHTLLHVSGPF
jgi:hypothetical protein